MKRIVGPIAISCWLVVASGCGVHHSDPQESELHTVQPAPPEDQPIRPIPEAHAPKTKNPPIQQPNPIKKKPDSSNAKKTPPPQKEQSALIQKKQQHKQQAQRKSAAKKAAAKKLTLPELRAKYPQTFKLHGSVKVKAIALTFDDGPDLRFTPQVLDVLKQHGVKATFFLIGTNAKAHPDIVKRIVKEGHAIGNHSFSHPLFTKLNVERFSREIKKTEDILRAQTGLKPKLIRPPYGAINEKQLLWAQKHGLTVVNWNIDSQDWKSLGSTEVSNNILSKTKAGAIVLQHSGGAASQDLTGTVKALPGIIHKLKKEGYRFLTVPQLLELSKK